MERNHRAERTAELSVQRLTRQLISRQPFQSPQEVVAWFGAMQAQDYLAALWALGLRTAKASEATVENALSEGRVIRTHVFRGTWQYVAREDLRWMLELVGARVIAGMGSRFRELELDDRTLKRCGELFAKALDGGRHLTRTEMAAVLAGAKIPALNRRLLHILGHAELDGVICSGARKGKQPTFALLDERVPRATRLSRDEALVRLTLRYFQSRGPATDRDLAWWTGLPLSEVRRGIEAAGNALRSAAVGGRTLWRIEGRIRPGRAPVAHLLPAFDEYQVAYQDRSDVLLPAYQKKMNAGGGILKPAVVVDGQIIGLWRRELSRDSVRITTRLFQPVTASQQKAIAEAASRYARFLGLAPRLLLKDGKTDGD